MTAPLPLVTPDTREFWTAGARNELMINRCRACGRWSHPPVPVCRWCHSRDIAPARSGGGGVVLTYTVNRQRWTADLEVPYALAIIALDDDPDLRITSRLVGVDVGEVRIGMRVAVRFEPVEDVWLPLFAPAAAT